jgi:hypothetical protein
MGHFRVTEKLSTSLFEGQSSAVKRKKFLVHLNLHNLVFTSSNFLPFFRKLKSHDMNNILQISHNRLKVD